ncbi:MAG: motility protein A [Lachnospiraceae bacterium]|nr:motility protein A [Lachnospiraceae bacterium]
MDLATIIGLIACIALMIFGIINGAGASALGSFWDVPSIMITFGGAFMAVLASSNLKDYIGGLKSIVITFKPPQLDETGTIKSVMDLSNIARKEGLLALEEAANNLEDEFLKKGVLLVVDGTDPELVRAILETELDCMENRHKKNMAFWDNVASMGPAWGMIGTLIGLINMLKDLDDPSAIGPAMATALVTTFYGSVLANWVATPTSNKLKVNHEAEYKVKVVIIEGLLSIQAGENPRVIGEKLKSFLSPAQRATFEDEEGGGEANG